MWDERYSAEGFAYGEAPNDFLVEAAHFLPGGRILCIAEGEGRNAVYLARKGYSVLAVDQSAAGLAKARKLAETHGIGIETEVADLADFDIALSSWSGVVSIFAHLPPAIRRPLHRGIVAGLAPGGVLLLEAYTPRQLAIGGVGGPGVRQADMLLTLDVLAAELAGLDILLGREIDREVNEGEYHRGIGAVVQFVTRKP